MSYEFENFGDQTDLYNAATIDRSEPTGFVNRTDSVLSKVNATRTFTIAPDDQSFDIWVAGRRLTIVQSLSVQWANSEGTHFFYLDGNGDLQTTTSFSVDLIKTYAWAAVLYWDATNGEAKYFADERHGIVMSGDVHSYLHNAFGTQYINGLSLGLTVDQDGSSAAHAQVAVTDGEIRDEDITHTIEDGSPQTLDPIAEIPVWYQLGAVGTWRQKTADTYPFVQSGSAGYTGASALPAYNKDTAGTWSLAEVANNDFVLTHIFATNDIDEPIAAVLGQAVYTTVVNARAGATTELIDLQTDGLPFVEWTPIGTIIIQCRTAYTNSVNARFVSTDDGDDYVDWRSVSLSPSGGTSVGSHNQLTGSSTGDDHTQYVHVDGRRGITQAVATSGTPVAWSVTSAAHTTLDNASIVHETHDYSATTQFVGGAASFASAVGFSAVAPVFDAAGAGLTIAQAATVAISGPPTAASGNVALTAAYSFWVQSGVSRFVGGGLAVDVVGNLKLGEDHSGDPGTRTDDTRKSGDFVAVHYSSEEQDLLMLRADCVSDAEAVAYWGGGSSSYNAVSRHEFYAASDATTLTGSHVFQLNTGGAVLGNQDLQATARTGLTLRAPDVVTGGAGNVSGADITIGAGIGTGTAGGGSVLGKIIFQTPNDAAGGAGDFIQARTTKVVIGSSLELQNGVYLLPNTANQNNIGSSAKTFYRIYGVFCHADTYVDSGGNTVMKFSGANAVAWFNGTPAVQQTSGANLTNNVTSGGTDDTVDNWTDLSTYATDAAAIRNAVYQLTRKLKQINDGLRLYNLFT